VNYAAEFAQRQFSVKNSRVAWAVQRFDLPRDGAL
jgi:hypothetical protein